MVSTFVALDLDRTLFQTMIYAEQIALGMGEPLDASSLHMDGADSLLVSLSRRDIPFGIMTFGPVEVQTAKIHAAGYEALPYMVVETPQKAQLIATWRQTDGTFGIPHALSGVESLYVDRVILVDDKATAFDGITDGIDGFLYRPDGVAVMEQQMGEVAASVRTLRSLTDLVDMAHL